MRKFILAVAALLSLSSAGYAAFAIFQTALPSGPARVQKGLVADYGATCNGVADDTAAFLAFKTANQGTTPVQLNLPTGTCTFLPTSGAGQRMFKGVLDLVVSGNGSANSSIKNTTAGSTQILMGGDGQTQDNLHSLRTDTANAGDSCVTIKTQPAVTVSAITNNLPVPATFTGSIPAAGTTLTVTAVASGTITIGAYITNRNSNINGFTSVTAQLTGTGGATCPDPSCNGGVGTYSVSTAQTNNIASQVVTTVPASFTGTVDAAGVLTVSAVSDGTLAVGMFVYRASGGVSSPTIINSQIGGTPGGAGTYQLSNAPLTALATPSGFIGNGQIRVTLNSTTGLTTGDTLYLTGVVAAGQIPQRTNGLRWIKVINGTQIDLFQSDFNGLYISGGTGGGDRTSVMPTGTKALMTGWINQAYWMFPYGFPSNPHWFEYRTVTSTNSGTHQVCLDTPLANTYKSTWPQYNTGSQFEVDPGGPATIYAMDPSWDMTVVFQNLAIDSPVQTYNQGRSATFNNVAMLGTECPVPTQNETYTWINVSASSCSIETDKLIKTWNITNSTVRKVTIQSSAMDTININTLTANQWIGSPKRLIANALTVTCSGCIATDPGLTVGTVAYGASDESICTNCSIANLFSYSSPIQQVDAANRAWSMSSGVITIPNAYSWSPSQNSTEIQTRGLVPGHYVVRSGGGGGGTVAQAGRIFKIVDVTQDTVNTYIQTNEAGGFSMGAWTTNGLSVLPHPAPMLTTSFTGGSANSALIFNGCPAQSPMWSCQNFTYTGSATGGSTQGFSPQLWGVLDTFTFTNNVPYTGSGALGWTVTRFANWQVLTTGLTTTSFGATNMINTKLPSSCGSCTRTLTQPGAANTQSLDSLTAPPTDAWFGGSPSNGPIFTANTPSDSPQVTITLRTSQNLPRRRRATHHKAATRLRKRSGNPARNRHRAASSCQVKVAQ